MQNSHTIRKSPVTSGGLSLEEVRKSFPATDMVGDPAIFNIRGNNYRLIVRVAWRSKRIYVKEFLTHAEYDKGRWKKWLA